MSFRWEIKIPLDIHIKLFVQVKNMHMLLEKGHVDRNQRITQLHPMPQLLRNWVKPQCNIFVNYMHKVCSEYYGPCHEIPAPQINSVNTDQNTPKAVSSWSALIAQASDSFGKNVIAC